MHVDEQFVQHHYISCADQNYFRLVGVCIPLRHYSCGPFFQILIDHRSHYCTGTQASFQNGWRNFRKNQSLCTSSSLKLTVYSFQQPGLKNGEKFRLLGICKSIYMEVLRIIQLTLVAANL